jgi:hypothetical protein
MKLWACSSPALTADAVCREEVARTLPGKFWTAEFGRRRSPGYCTTAGGRRRSTCRKEKIAGEDGGDADFDADTGGKKSINSGS